MSRALFRSLFRWLTQPSLVGAAYVLGLAAWAARSPTLDEREGGAQARQIDAVVHGPFAHEITRMGVAIAAAAIGIGATLGCAAAGLLWLRDLIGRRPELRPRSTPNRACLLLALVAAMHGGLLLWGMVHDPQLYADAWYARGGWRRAVQLFATDVLGADGVTAVLLIACAAFIAGPPSGFLLWPRRASNAIDRIQTRLARRSAIPWPAARRVVALCTAVGSAATLLALAVAQTPSASARSPDDHRPNILVLAADSLRADRLDSRTAPHLSWLASHGTRFDHAYVSLPRTFPSWVTLLTGRHPHHHGIRSMFPRWEERARNFDALPARLAQAGWATGVVSDYAGDIFSRIDLGFGTVDVPQFNFRQLIRQQALEREAPLLPVLDSRVGRAAFPVMREMNAAADPSLLAQDAVRMMRQLASRGPFFLVVFFSTAHFPYAAPAPYYGRFTDPAYRGRYKYDKPVGLGHEAPPDGRDEKQVQALYDGAVSAIDDAAQSVLDALASDGRMNKTIVVITADHGETLFDAGHGIGHGDHLFGDEGTHVPLVIIDPRRATPHRDASVVRDVDLAPTLYALAGVRPPNDLDGHSLDHALDGRPVPAALAYAETELWFTEEIPGLSSALRIPYPGIARLTEVDTRHGDEVVLRREMRALTIVARHRMVRDDRWKLVYVPTRTGVRWILFDTRSDPGEERDVAAAHPDVVARLQPELWTWMRRDAEMTERGGYLVPRDADESVVARTEQTEQGAVRVDDSESQGGR
ncbi:MAG: sulfatase-like hydrolase/transferase [Myxococcota bacterium]|nr:sulfatase-like hydrolase/transferase [Myxococcota bacterium]